MIYLSVRQQRLGEKCGKWSAAKGKEIGSALRRPHSRLRGKKWKANEPDRAKRGPSSSSPPSRAAHSASKQNHTTALKRPPKHRKYHSQVGNERNILRSTEILGELFVRTRMGVFCSTLRAKRGPSSGTVER